MHPLELVERGLAAEVVVAQLTVGPVAEHGRPLALSRVGVPEATDDPLTAAGVDTAVFPEVQAELEALLSLSPEPEPEP